MKVSEFQQESSGRKATINIKVLEQQSLLYLFLPAHHRLQILIHESKLLLQLSDSTGLVQHEQRMGERGGSHRHGVSQGGVHWSMHLGNKGRERTRILAVVSEPQSCPFLLMIILFTHRVW